MRGVSEDEAAGQTTSPTSPAVIKSEAGQFLTRQPHCETCGLRCYPVLSEGHLVAYACPVHGPLTHDEIVWVRHEIGER